ncbi:MAG: patatin-like phospholipase family protein [Robiginitomaculum sp.]|nr:patatin-like phospholipase family protein [Robiginitomaculum sp.]
MARFVVLFSLIATLFLNTANAQESQVRAKSRPKIGLVLGGGGAKGLAHVGVIKALEENQIPIDVIAGTSMGAIVGALYASGYSADELVNITSEMDWHSVFNDKTSRSRSTFRKKADEFGFLTGYKVTFKDGKIVLPQGIIQGQNLFLELSSLLSETRSVGRFEELPIPFKLVATDLSTGKAVVMEDGDLATAVFASMAIPGLIPPVERDGKYLIDGGLVNNLPVNLARQLGADIVIVVNVGTDPKPASEIGNFIEVLRQTQIILTQQNTEFQLSTLNANDVLILPSLEGLSAASFDQADTMAERGEAAAQGVLSQLAAFRLNDLDWHTHLMSRLAIPQIRPVIDKVSVSQNSKLTDEILRAGISVKPGQIFDPTQLNQDIDRLYGNGIYDRITYKIEQINSETVLQISAKVKESSDGYFKFGVSLDSNLENKSSFKLGVSYTKPQSNQWGGEWRTELDLGDTFEAISEFYQPIGARQRFFIEPSIFLGRDKDEFFDAQDKRRGDIIILGYGGSLQSGVLFGRWGELRAGYTQSKIRVSLTDDTLLQNPISLNDSFLLGRMTVDTLDSLSFPTEGMFLAAEYEIHDDYLGGQTEYHRSSLNAYQPFTFGRHTFGLGTRFSGSSGRDANLFGSAELGGFLSLSGFSNDEISDQYSAMAFGTYYYRLNKQATLFDLPLYIGGSLEMGNVYPSYEQIKLADAIYASSIFAGLKSPLGPVFVGIGYNDKGNTSLYFSIGSFF